LGPPSDRSATSLTSWSCSFDDGKTPEDIEGAIREEIARTGARRFPQTCRGARPHRADREGGSESCSEGVNLATLVDCVFNTELPPTEAARAAAERGKASLIVVGR
jgi:hypothetical protein